MKKIKPYRIRRCIIKESSKIRELLIKRFQELELTSRAIVEDARNKEVFFEAGALSKYLNFGNTKGCLSQENIIWLCDRYCIDLKLTAKKKKYEPEPESE